MITDKAMDNSRDRYQVEYWDLLKQREGISHKLSSYKELTRKMEELKSKMGNMGYVKPKRF